LLHLRFDIDLTDQADFHPSPRATRFSDGNHTVEGGGRQLS